MSATPDPSQKERWDEMYQQLVPFREKNVHCDVLSVRWNEMYQQLVAFRKKNGHCNVPKRCQQNKKLGTWVLTQRKTYKSKKLIQDRIDKLNKIDFVWEVNAGNSSGVAALQAERQQEEMEAASVSLLNDEVQLKLQEEMRKAMECMEASQLELSNEKIKSSKLQESLEVTKKKLEEKLTLIEKELEEELAPEDEVKQLNATTLQSKIAGLEQDMNVVKAENNALTEKMKDVMKDTTAKQVELETLQQENEEVSAQLTVSVEKESTLLEAFKLKEDEFSCKVKEAQEKVDALISEKASTAEKLVKVLAENSALMTELESFKAQNIDVVDSFEDECVLVNEERDIIEAKLSFAHADLQRTIRFHEATAEVIEDVHSQDLIQRDEHIYSLLQERNLLQEKFKSVSDELVKAKCDHDEKVEVIEMIKEQYAKSTTQLKDDREKSEMLEKEVAELKAQLENEKERTELANVELKKQQEEIDNMSAHLEVFKLKEDNFLFKISQLKQSLNAAQKVGRKSKNNLEARKGTESIYDNKDQKAILRESLADSVVMENPNVRWDDVAGLEKAKESLKESVITPLQHPQLFTGTRKPFSGVLLYGPPGTGKTYLAKAVATEADTTFFCVSASDLVSKWQGESARLVRNLFEMARESPSRAIIFIDEVESLCRSRNESESNDERQTMTELLSQMDGVKKNKDKVFVLGATNLPWEIDPAMRRRFEKRIYIPLPGQEERSAMFKIHLAGVPNNLKPNDCIELGKSTEGLSGADIEVFVKDALYEPVRNCFDAKQFRQVGHYWMPCKNNPNCPTCLTDYKSTCERCGAKRMDYSDVPKGKLVAPDVTLKDFEKVWLAGKFATVSKDDTEEYTTWTTEFGRK